MNRHEAMQNFMAALGKCGAPLGIEFTFLKRTERRVFRVVSSVEEGRPYVSFVFPDGQTHRVVSVIAPDIQAYVIATTTHFSAVFDDPRTQVVYEVMDDRDEGIEVCVNQRGCFVRLRVHLPRKSCCEVAQQMPTVVPVAWIEQMARLRGFVAGEEVESVARRGRMIYREEIPIAAKGYGMMTPAEAREQGWLPPDAWQEQAEMAGWMPPKGYVRPEPSDEEYNAAYYATFPDERPSPSREALAAQVEDIAAEAEVARASRQAAGEGNGNGDGKPATEEAVEMGAAAPDDGSTPDADGQGVEGRPLPAGVP